MPWYSTTGQCNSGYNWLYLVFDVFGGLPDHHPATGFIHRTQAGDVYSGNGTTGDSNYYGYGGAE
ncbi:MAG: hypothetical protein HXM76_05030 [Mogibacterium diversum]|nr:hypothetical protein [Mogibacterium diversum]